MRRRVQEGVLPATVTEEEVLVVRGQRKAAKSTMSVPEALMSRSGDG